MSLIDPKLVEKYPYLDITEADLKALIDTDPVVQGALERIKHFEAKSLEYDQRRAENQAHVDRLVDERNALEARLRANDTEIREARGRVAQCKYHKQLGDRRIQERLSAIAKRQRFLFKEEVRRRLARMGKELKLNVGLRAAKGLGTEIIDKAA